MELNLNEREAKKLRRRELLKLSPVLLLGAFAIPSFQDALLEKGLAFHDWATSRFFRRSHLAPTFRIPRSRPSRNFRSTITTSTIPAWISMPGN